MGVKAIPDGYPVVTPYLIVNDCARLIEFLQAAFGAEVRMRIDAPDGRLMHAEVRIDGAPVMMGEPMGEFGAMPATVFLYMEDCDAGYRRAIAAGGVSVMKPTTMEHAGERYGGVKDPCGNIWWPATHVEDISPEESQRRINEAFGEKG